VRKDPIHVYRSPHDVELRSVGMDSELWRADLRVWSWDDGSVWFEVHARIVSVMAHGRHEDMRRFAQYLLAACDAAESALSIAAAQEAKAKPIPPGAVSPEASAAFRASLKACAALGSSPLADALLGSMRLDDTLPPGTMIMKGADGKIVAAVEPPGGAK
jgi:hypothetical protein